MRELERVLAYPHIVSRMDFYRVDAAQVLAAFDAQARLVDIAPRVAYVCKDADDQKFIDLAAAHRAILLSKDKAVICMRKAPDAGCPRGHRAGAGRKRGRSRCLKAAAAVWGQTALLAPPFIRRS
jgi:predicted nucleic acid-binding protein